MIISIDELYLKYKNYKNPKDKIYREINDNQTYIKVCRGIYETNKNVERHLLAPIIESDSYLSFEYALAYYGLIPERVYVYTSATTLKRHNRKVKNYFGTYTYTDVPLDVWRFGIERIEDGDYVYLIACKEKALCDTLYKKPAVDSLIELKELLFEDMRIDVDEFYELNFEDIISICDLYKKKNLKLLKKMLEKEIKNDK